MAYMQLLKWFSLMKEVVMCNNNLRLKSPFTRSTDDLSLLKHRNFDFANFFFLGGGEGMTVILNLIFRSVG